MTLITDYTFTPCRYNKLKVKAAITYFNMLIFHHLILNYSFENLRSNTLTLISLHGTFKYTEKEIFQLQSQFVKILFKIKQEIKVYNIGIFLELLFPVFYFTYQPLSNTNQSYDKSNNFHQMNSKLANKRTDNNKNNILISLSLTQVHKGENYKNKQWSTQKAEA